MKRILTVLVPTSVQGIAFHVRSDNDVRVDTDF